MKFKIFITIFSVLIIASITYDNFYTTNIISGTYCYDFDNAVPEGPDKGDILILKENGNFKSDTWGSGTYKIEGSRITFNTAELGFQTSLYRPFFWGNPRISISADFDYYFEQK